jgi:predicted transcriptional regulator of viral defense system
MTKTKKKKAATWPQQIITSIAAGRGGLADLDKLPNANPDSIRWYVSRMTSDGLLKRVGVGEYKLARPPKTKTIAAKAGRKVASKAAKKRKAVKS